MALVANGWHSPAQPPVLVTVGSVFAVVFYRTECNAVSELLQQLCKCHSEPQHCCKCYLSSGHADALNFECHIGSQFDQQVLC